MTRPRSRDSLSTPAQAAAVFKEYPDVVNWQIRVNNPGGRDSLVVLVETGMEFDEERFIVDFQNIMKLKPVVEVVEPGTLPDDAAKLVDERTFD